MTRGVWRYERLRRHHFAARRGDPKLGARCDQDQIWYTSMKYPSTMMEMEMEVKVLTKREDIRFDVRSTHWPRRLVPWTCHRPRSPPGHEATYGTRLVDVPCMETRS